MVVHGARWVVGEVSCATPRSSQLAQHPLEGRHHPPYLVDGADSEMIESEGEDYLIHEPDEPRFARSRLNYTEEQEVFHELVLKRAYPCQEGR